MTKKPQPNQTRKLKTNPTEPLLFSGYNPDKPTASGRDSLPRHSLIYSEPMGEQFRKDFHYWYEIYLETAYPELPDEKGEPQPILNHVQAGIWRHLLSLKSRGLGFSVKTFCKHFRLDEKTFRIHCDRLQDAKLLHRVCRPDKTGGRHDYVLHSPRTHLQWTFDGKSILERVRLEVTRLERAERGETKTYVRKDGKEVEQRVLARNKCCPPQHQFDARRVLKHFADAAEAEVFTMLVLDTLFQMNREKLQGRPDAKQMFLENVKASAQKNDFWLTGEQWQAAFILKNFYAPEMF